MLDVRTDPQTGDALLAVKAVPGASRDAIAGLLGGRLKVRVAAPPEGGKANDAIRRLLARAVGVDARAVSIEAGHTSPLKTVRIAGVDAATVRAALGPGG